MKKLSHAMNIVAILGLSCLLGYFAFSNSAYFQSPFSTSVASAFCGTFAAALMVWLIEQQRSKIRFRRDGNIALARIHSNLYSLINFKRVHLLPLMGEAEKVHKTYSEFVSAFKKEDAKKRIGPDDFPKINTSQLLKKISPPKVNRSLSIVELVTEDVAFHQMVILSEQANGVILELFDLCAKWERTLEEYFRSSMSERARLAIFFGAYPSSTGCEGHIRDLIKEMYVQTEAALAFLDILAEKTRNHVIEVQGSKDQVLNIELTGDFRKLMPSREAFRHWESF